MELSKRLEYVSSGNSHIRINVTPEETPEYQQYLETINHAFTDMNTSSHNHHYSLLYNAYTESGFGEIFQNYRKGIYKIHADSGGLQVVTQGLSITNELKTKVYQNQSKWADIGMSFDEIPVTLTSQRSTRLDFSNRYFDIDKFHSSAKQTGLNLNEQINYFRENNSGCKPYLITQGNDLDTYTQWVEIILEQLEGDNYNYIGGVAMGAAAFGMGTLEDIKKNFFYSEICKMLPNRHLHLLGVGSIARLLPSLIFMKNGRFDSDDHPAQVSYDSSTHTSGQNYGRVYDEAMKLCSMTTPSDYDRAYQLIVKHFPWAADEFTSSQYRDLLYSAHKETKPENIYRRYLTKNLTGLADIKTFISHVDQVYDNLEVGLGYISNKQEYYPIKALFSVRSKEDYYEWERQYAQVLTSKAYPTCKPNTLF
jgi:hypothetical protein